MLDLNDPFWLSPYITLYGIARASLFLVCIASLKATETP